MSAKRVLVVEDDAAVRRGVVDALRFSGFQPLEAGTYGTALEAATRDRIDLLLLDLVLPGGDGLNILTAARKERSALPVIILTARGQESERVRGLNLGADDYVVKPFSVHELLARIEAVLRRTPGRPEEIVRFEVPGGEVNLERCDVRFEDGQTELLSDRELALLRYLVQSRGRVVSREELLERVWRLSASGVRTRTVDMHIARLREKLRDDPEDPHILVTIRGKGYRFDGRPR